MKANIFRSVVFSAMAIAASHSHAQSTLPRPTITRAEDFIQSFPKEVSVGTNVVFKQKTSSAANALLNSGLQIRIFALTDNEMRPSKITTNGDCDVFISRVWSLDVLSTGDIRFTKMDEGWINVSDSGESTKPGRWFLVFEHAGPSHEEFRIKASDSSGYFSAGFIITVRENQSISLQKVAAEYKRRDIESVRLLRAVDERRAAVPCYTYKRVQVAELPANGLEGAQIACLQSDHADSPL